MRQSQKRNKDDVIDLHAEVERRYPQRDDKTLQSKNDLHLSPEKRPQSAHLVPPPKTAMSKSQSLMQLNKARPTSANIVDYSEMLEERSNVGSIHSVIGRGQSKNGDLLRVSQRCFIFLASKQEKHRQRERAVRRRPPLSARPGEPAILAGSVAFSTSRC